MQCRQIFIYFKTPFKIQGKSAPQLFECCRRNLPTTNENISLLRRRVLFKSFLFYYFGTRRFHRKIYCSLIQRLQNCKSESWSQQLFITSTKYSICGFSFRFFFFEISNLFRKSSFQKQQRKRPSSRLIGPTSRPLFICMGANTTRPNRGVVRRPTTGHLGLTIRMLNIVIILNLIRCFSLSFKKKFLTEFIKKRKTKVIDFKSIYYQMYYRN